ncbi:MAG: hypothetical protein ACLQDL_17195 [Spirochaetia bacterium]
MGDFGTADPLGVSWAFIIAMFLIIVFDFVLRRTVYGRNRLLEEDSSRLVSCQQTTDSTRGNSMKMSPSLPFVDTATCRM